MKLLDLVACRTLSSPRGNTMRSTLAFFVALAFASPALALDSDKDKPLDVTSDRFEGGPNDETSVLTGHVHMTQGSIVGTGDKADIHQKDKNVTRVVLFGAPATLKQDVEGGGTVNAKAKNIDYDVTAKHAILTGDAVVTHPRGEARGEHLTYDVETGKMTGDGQGGDGQTHLHFVPETEAEKKAKEEAKKAKDAEKPKVEKPKADKAKAEPPKEEKK